MDARLATEWEILVMAPDVDIVDLVGIKYLDRNARPSDGCWRVNLNFDPERFVLNVNIPLKRCFHANGGYLRR